MIVRRSRLVALLAVVLVLGGCAARRGPARHGAPAPNDEAARFRAKMIHDGATPELADWEAWITFYYADPQPARTVGAIRFLSKRGDLRRNPQPIAAFFGRVFAQNPAALPEWVDQLKDGPEDQQFFTAIALWFSNVEGRDALWQRLADGGPPSLGRYLEELRRDVAPDLTTLQPGQAVELDMLWASFFATGDTRYVGRIIDLLPPGRDWNATLAAAARWSLTANSVAHRLVLEFCRQQAVQQPARAGLLQEIVAQAEDERYQAERARR